MAAETHKNLKNKHPGLLSIIAPRHPQRGDSLVKQLTELNLTIARRSESQAINADTDIYLADTIGEMGLFYRLSDIAFIGGTVTPPRRTESSGSGKAGLRHFLRPVE